ncbi:hypothetical protein [uncultured Caulobacter sp.]|uniref:hypothetical protein n=1 Tax=uncultured Caulobacter sp. TaxID=158749 RepID=UPI00260B503A|nr:hypothetical protein [uncultured Caulobacter sp.]
MNDSLLLHLNLLAKNLHRARVEADTAKKALEKYDAEDGEITQLKKLLADAQKRLDERLAGDEVRKTLQTTATIATEKSEQAEKAFKSSVEEAKIQSPDLKAKEIPGVKSFTDKLTIEITSPERAVDIVIEKLRGIKGLLTINTEVVKQLYEAGLLASAGWFVAKQAYTVSVDKDLSHVADILETTEEPPKVETLFTFD